MIAIGSLFSGIGGIELGFEWEGGYETRWCVESDSYCQALLRKHWPDVPIYGDIRTVDFSGLEPVDILTGGFPCQDISCANPKGTGLSGSRSGLWSYYAEAIRVLRPKYAVIENVPNLTNKGLNVVLGDLAEIGYDAEWNIISARGVGARHLRKRLFIVAYPQCEPRYVRADEAGGERRDESALVNAGESGTDVADSDKLNGYASGYRASAVCVDGQEKAKLRGSESLVNATSARLSKPETEREQIEVFEIERGSLLLRELCEQNERGIWRRDPADLADSASCTKRHDSENIGKIYREIDTFADPSLLSSESDVWAAQSRVGRVANGVPKRVDRLRGLGNAVVPQVAQFIARRIKEIEKK